MGLSAEQQAQLDALLAQKDAPAYRTSSGIAGVLHKLADVVSGAVAHVGPDEWTALHDAIEAAAGDGGGDQGAEQPASSPGEQQ